MTKKFLTFLCLVFVSLVIYATEVGSERAAAVGLNFWKIHSLGINDINTNQSAIIKTIIIAEGGEAQYYIFDIYPGGFVIVAADDAVIPVLGYSLEGYYQDFNQSIAFTSWMNNYKLQINAVRQKNLKADQGASEAWTYYTNLNPANFPKGGAKGISPLLTTKWDQDAGYNDKCPEHSGGPGGHCYVGCVATAMAQVMKFWNYPEHGFGSHSYQHPFYGIIGVDFSAATYDWASMTNTLNNASKESISLLMYHCAVAVDMYFTPTGSASYTSLTKDALKNFFHYRSTIRYNEKIDYSWEEWRRLIMENIDDGKPVLYSGSGSSGGHAWVCDGYQDTTYFHMNWGWSGYNNGYFALEDLNSGNGDFSAGQGAVTSIIPDNAPYCIDHKIFTEKFRDFGDGSIYSYYWNNTNCDWLIQPENATDITLNFTQFITEEGKDFVSVYDGATTSAPLLGIYSGINLPPILTSTGGSMLVVFTSDATTQCLGWEASYFATIVGTDDYDLSSLIAIYPNPAYDKLTLHINSLFAEDLQVHITSITGQEILSSRISAGSGDVVIDISGIRQGIYMLTLTGEQSHYTTKLVIK